MRPTGVLMRQAMIQFRHGKCNAAAGGGQSPAATPAAAGGKAPAPTKPAAPKAPHIARPLGPNVTMVCTRLSSLDPRPEQASELWGGFSCVP